MIVPEMCVFVWRTMPGVRREAHFCVSVSNFPCYNKKSHPLLEILLVPKRSGKCLQLVIIYSPDLFRCAMCESAQPAFKT